MLVRPITIKPARRNRATTGASASAGVQSSSSAREPARVTCPLMSNRSLIETGMPANGDGAAWALRSRSIASAAPRAPSLSTWMKARSPSPEGSAILARHSSTSLRAEVRPLSRSAASEASAGMFGMIFSLFPWAPLLVVRTGLNVEIEQRRAQRFAVSVERQRPRHAAAERLGHDEIQRRQIGKFIADHLTLHNAGKMRLHPFAGDLRQQDRRHRDHVARRLPRAAAGGRAVGIECFDLVADPDCLAEVFSAPGDAD